MLRFVFNAMALLSVLVFILAAAFWLRGQFASAVVYYTTMRNRWSLGGSRSGVGLWAFSLSDDITSTPFSTPGAEPFLPKEWRLDCQLSQKCIYWVENLTRLSVDGAGPQTDFLHFVVMKRPFRAIITGTVLFIHIPYWLLLLVCSIFPTTWLIRRRLISRRRRLGLCKACGYDLRGGPTSAACPECGVAQAR